MFNEKSHQERIYITKVAKERQGARDVRSAAEAALNSNRSADQDLGVVMNHMLDHVVYGIGKGPSADVKFSPEQQKIHREIIDRDSAERAAMCGTAQEWRWQVPEHLWGHFKTEEFPMMRPYYKTEGEYLSAQREFISKLAAAKKAYKIKDPEPTPPDHPIASPVVSLTPQQVKLNRMKSWKV